MSSKKKFIKGKDGKFAGSLPGEPSLGSPSDIVHLPNIPATPRLISEAETREKNARELLLGCSSYKQAEFTQAFISAVIDRELEQRADIYSQDGEVYINERERWSVIRKTEQMIRDETFRNIMREDDSPGEILNLMGPANNERLDRIAKIAENVLLVELYEGRLKNKIKGIRGLAARAMVSHLKRLLQI